MLEGLEALRVQPSENADLDKLVREVSQRQGYAHYMLANDVVQVIYGRGKTLLERFDLVYIIAFGTDLGFRGAIAQVKFLFQIGAIGKMGYRKYFLFLMRSLPRGVKIFWHCRKQNKKWPLLDNWHYLNTPIEKIHTEFGIRI